MTERLKEQQTVRVKRNLEICGIPLDVGDVGTIIHSYQDSIGSSFRYCEVEFEGIQEVVTMNEEDLEAVE